MGAPTPRWLLNEPKKFASSPDSEFKINNVSTLPEGRRHVIMCRPLMEYGENRGMHRSKDRQVWKDRALAFLAAVAAAAKGGADTRHSETERVFFVPEDNGGHDHVIITNWDWLNFRQGSSTPPAALLEKERPDPTNVRGLGTHRTAAMANFLQLLMQRPQAPRIPEHPGDIVMRKHEPVTLRCRADAQPPACLSWFHEGRPLARLGIPHGSAAGTALLLAWPVHPQGPGHVALLVHGS
ncbi:hypothetical protein HPB47_005983 [Ixodes persulcatus]|uniref:Uncharacterized protein n=1 Tax=Ixodes persulcatus TaxID=34615 RepID=A0AC60PBF4_IXOPE|nr:hypothetical protein HPB47_005983 [Ixodes persulcatus]